MAFVFYGEVDKSAEMAGCAEALLTETMQKLVNNWINLKIRKEGFGSDTNIELFDIKESNVNFLILDKIPIINNSVEIIDDVNGDDPVIVNSECYVVDNETGIIQLLSDQSFSSVDSISYFHKGIKSVSVEYEYGYVAVPEDIIDFATLLLAKWGKVKTLSNANADGLKSIKAADYTETYDLSFMSVDSEFDNTIKDMFKLLKVSYNKGV